MKKEIEVADFSLAGECYGDVLTFYDRGDHFYIEASVDGTGDTFKLSKDRLEYYIKDKKGELNNEK